MRVFPRNFSRSAWVVFTNGLMLYGLLVGITSVDTGVAIANGTVAAALSAGIFLEVTGRVGAAALNVVSFLYVPLFWLWERTHDANFGDHAWEYNLSLVLFVVPCIVIVAVDLLFYMPPLFRRWHGRKTMPS
jgi:hypothetical protein